MQYILHGTVHNFFYFTGISFSRPSFSGLSYLMLRSLGNITGDFYIDIAFHTMNRDGIMMFASQRKDGTGQFISLAISGGKVEFR